MSPEISLLVSVLMLLGNAFFVGAEFGLVSARRSNIELAALDGSRAARVTLSAMEQVSLMLAAAQLGVTACSLVLGAVSEPLIAHLLESPLHHAGLSESATHGISLVIALIITVYLHVVIGEMVPKNLALASPARTALILTPPLVVFVKLTRPLVLFLNFIANRFLRLCGVTPKQEIESSFSRDEVAGFVRESQQEGLLSEDEEQLLAGALSLDARTVRSVLIPMEDIATLKASASPKDVEAASVELGFSRFPVKKSDGTLVGYVHLKDALEVRPNAYESPMPAHYIWPLQKLAPGTSLREAIVSMQQSGSHLAQIIGSGGKPLGIIALEDVLEKLVGVIHDESHDESD